jgi:hypothetical protein
MEALITLQCFVSCFGIHKTLEIFNRRLASSLTCCLFQVYFVSKSFMNLYNEYYQLQPFEAVRQSTFVILYEAIGYFVYDTIYTIHYKEPQWKLFTAHHIAGLSLLFMMLNEGIKETWAHNLVCFTSEIINPALNLRYALADWFGKKSLIYQANRYLIVIQYTIFRIIGFPIVAYQIAPFISNPVAFYVIYTLTVGLYCASVMWYRKLLSNLWGGKIEMAAGE